MVRLELIAIWREKRTMFVQILPLPNVEDQIKDDFHCVLRSGRSERRQFFIIRFSRRSFFCQRHISSGLTVQRRKEENWKLHRKRINKCLEYFLSFLLSIYPWRRLIGAILFFSSSGTQVCLWCELWKRFLNRTEVENRIIRGGNIDRLSSWRVKCDCQ